MQKRNLKSQCGGNYPSVRSVRGFQFSGGSLLTVQLIAFPNVGFALELLNSRDC